MQRILCGAFCVSLFVDHVISIYSSIMRDSLASRVRPDGDSNVAHEATDHVHVQVNVVLLCNQSIFCSDQDHKIHSCDTRLCPATCELCKRLCSKPHLHGLAS
ncbi:hypothetical protein EDB87DRAFT_1221631 [Lactarius vividus]|nr:hypothetical protein EDB87DRAFT_1221631 [Lactarius vividus]